MTNRELEKIALEYLENEISLKDLSKKHCLSKTELIRYFKGEKDIKLSRDMQKQIDERKSIRWKKSKSTKGNKDHFKLTKEEIKIVAYAYVEEGKLALKEIAALKNVSPATIYNSFNEATLGKELYEKVLDKYESIHPGRSSNKRN